MRLILFSARDKEQVGSTGYDKRYHRHNLRQQMLTKVLSSPPSSSPVSSREKEGYHFFAIFTLELFLRRAIASSTFMESVVRKCKRKCKRPIAKNLQFKRICAHERTRRHSDDDHNDDEDRREEEKEKRSTKKCKRKEKDDNYRSEVREPVVTVANDGGGDGGGLDRQLAPAGALSGHTARYYSSSSLLFTVSPPSSPPPYISSLYTTCSPFLCLFSLSLFLLYLSVNLSPAFPRSFYHGLPRAGRPFRAARLTNMAVSRSLP